jgi:hypothetical protein
MVQLNWMPLHLGKSRKYRWSSLQLELWEATVGGLGSAISNRGQGSDAKLSPQLGSLAGNLQGNKRIVFTVCTPKENADSNDFLRFVARVMPAALEVQGP